MFLVLTIEPMRGHQSNIGQQDSQLEPFLQENMRAMNENAGRTRGWPHHIFVLAICSSCGPLLGLSAISNGSHRADSLACSRRSNQVDNNRTDRRNDQSNAIGVRVDAVVLHVSPPHLLPVAFGVERSEELWIKHRAVLFRKLRINRFEFVFVFRAVI